MHSMDNQKIVGEVSGEVRRALEHEGSGHDWWHVYRVWKMAERIGKEESADLFVIELAALLHDIADWKFHDGDDTVGPKMAREVLTKYGVPTTVIAHACDIIANASFKGAGVQTDMKTLEGKIVQDADRLDAIGAIGIARTFAFNGYMHWPMHDPRVIPVMHQSKEEYFKSTGTAITHFYEKLLLLKDRMNTKTAKKLAEDRHHFMEEYLDRFFKEWEGKS